MNVMEQFINYFLTLQLSYWIIIWLCLCSFVPLFSVAGDGGSRRLPDVEKLAAEEPEKHELWQSSLPEDHRRRPQHRHHPAQRQCGTHLSCGELTTKAPLCTEQHGQDVLIPEHTLHQIIITRQCQLQSTKCSSVLSEPERQAVLKNIGSSSNFFFFFDNQKVMCCCWVLSSC